MTKMLKIRLRTNGIRSSLWGKCKMKEQLQKEPFFLAVLLKHILENVLHLISYSQHSNFILFCSLSTKSPQVILSIPQISIHHLYVYICPQIFISSPSLSSELKSFIFNVLLLFSHGQLKDITSKCQKPLIIIFGIPVIPLF